MRFGGFVSWMVLVTCVLMVQPASAAVLYGASSSGDLFTINLTTGAGTPVGVLGFEPTEIACPSATGRNCFLQLRDGGFAIAPFDILVPKATGALVPDGHSFTGLEYVNGVLYGTSIDDPGGPSTLRTLDPLTGISSAIGLTGVVQISGLAFDTTGPVMYGIAGGPGPADFYTIDLNTGLATVVGSTGIQAGSLRFGPDGKLYAGGTGSDAGNLYRITPATGASQLVGNTGFGGVTSLAVGPDALPVPTLSTWASVVAIVGLALLGARRLRRVRVPVRAL